MAWSTAQGWLNPNLAAPLANAAVVTLVVYGLWRNRYLKSIWLAALGLALNTIAIATNGGHMPVSPDALRAAGLEDFLHFMEKSSDAVHGFIGLHTRFWFLGDVLPLPLFKKVISPGDAMLLLSILFFFPETTQAVIKKRRSQKGDE